MLKISNEYDVHRRSMTETDFHQRLQTFVSGAQRRVMRWQTSAQTLWCDSTLTDFSKGSKSHNFVSIGSMHNVYMEWMGSQFTHADVE